MSTATINAEMIQGWVSDKILPSEVKEKLRAMGLEDYEVEIYLKEYNKLRRGKRQITGFIVTASGALLGLISCVITLMHQSSDHFGFTLFGLTSVAALIIFYGLYLIFE